MNPITKQASLVLLTTCLLISTNLSAQEPAKQAKFDTALLIIDVQNFYFPKGALPLSGIEKAAERAKAVLDAFRHQNLPVVHVKHIPVREGVNPKDPQWAIHSTVQPKPTEKVVVKHHVNSFRDTRLLRMLKKLGTQKLVILGMQTHMCVEAAVRAAADLGFQVLLVHDACATSDIKYGKTVIPAKLVQAETLASLVNIYAKLVSSNELIRQMQPPQLSDKQR